MIDWLPDISQYLITSDYISIVRYYEQLIENEPDNISHYWYLGIAYLLSGDEDSAQTTWWMSIAQVPESDVEQCTAQLTKSLYREAKRQLKNSEKYKSLLLCSYAKEVNPLDINNLLLLICLNNELQKFEPQSIYDWNICNLLQQSDTQVVDIEQLFQTVQQVLKYPTLESVALAQASINHVHSTEQWIEMLVRAASDLGYYQRHPLLGIELIQFCLQLQPNSLSALEHLPRLYLEASQYQLAIQAGIEFYNQCSTIDSRFFSNALLLKSMLSAGVWNELTPIANRHKILLRQLMDTQPLLSLRDLKALVVYTGCLFYLQDNLPENRWFQNESAKLFNHNLVANTAVKLPLSHSYRPHTNKRLKIGYIAHTLRSHSVGWLSRWLFQHHDRDSFHLSLYLFGCDPQDPFYLEWFEQKVDEASFSKDDIPAMAEKIRDNNVDILIDLDSITLDHTVTVMGLKPAPIQATWLGWDASGLPTVDYFIADPYVLPVDAEQHYSEKILRLPQTYIAVNGFEIDVPTLNRSDLGISADGVIYYSAQSGMKRHPEMIQLQLQIIKEVPNSFFLIKGLADETSIQEMFLDLATDMGIGAERLKFLPMMPTEMIHRANLGIADIVLDTFPYNGATTTLETLWMGIPLVTRVGTQFAARNSYTFLMNAGISEGIAWSAQEYVEWGVRFGCDLQLRLGVAWKLRQSRKTSPLWNTQKFTKHMENAYQEMWHNYLEGYSQ